MPCDIQAMLATVLRYREAPMVPPIHITIVAGKDEVGIRISDQGLSHPINVAYFLTG